MNVIAPQFAGLLTRIKVLNKGIVYFFGFEGGCNLLIFRKLLYLSENSLIYW